MKKCILVVLFFSLGKEYIAAQQTDSLRYKYTNQTIYRYGSYFLKGTERLTFQGLRNEFSMSDLGLAGYDRARKYKRTSTILRYLSLGSGIAALAVLSNHGNRNTGIILLGSQLVLSMGAMRYGGLSSQSLDQALWQRNKDLLFPLR